MMSEAGSVEAMMRSPPGFPSFVTSPGVVDHTRVSQPTFKPESIIDIVVGRHLGHDILLEPQFLPLQPCLQTKHWVLSSQGLEELQSKLSAPT